MKVRDALSRALRRLKSSPVEPHLLAVIGMGGFALSIAALLSVHIGTDFTDIPTREYFFFQVLPLAYWIGIGLLVGAILCLSYFDRWGSRWVVVLSLLLMVSMRVVLTLTLTHWLPYDTISRDIPQVETWLHHGITFVPGTYAHSWPLAYLVAYAFVGVGIPVDTFFEWAIVPIYAIEVLLVYSTASLFLDRRAAAIAVFLFALISLDTEGGIIVMFYNPALLGATFYLLSLYLILRLATKSTVRLVDLVAPCASIFLMILSHHLTVVYFIVTILGVWLVSKSRLARFSTLNLRLFPFFTLFTSVTWAVYGVLVFPETLDTWASAIPAILLHRSYPHTFSSQGVGSYLGQPWFDMVAFVAVPIFIGGLFALYLFRARPRDRTRPGLLGLLRSWRPDSLAVLSLGLLCVLGLAFVAGLAFSGILYPIRMLEYGLYLMLFLASPTLLYLLSSRRIEVRLVVFVLAVAVTILSIYWTYHIIQRTLPLWLHDLQTGG